MAQVYTVAGWNTSRKGPGMTAPTPASPTGTPRDMSVLLRAAATGQAVGDALGVPFEFRIRDSFRCDGMVGHGTHDRPAGTWSDDTAMMLATLDSLAANRGRVDPMDLLRRFRDWMDRGAYTPDGVVFDIGGTTSSALVHGHGGDGEMDNGNGSLMRILPLAFVDCSDDDVRAASAVTHAHPTSTGACVRFVRVARSLIRGHADPVEWSRAAGVDDLASAPRDAIRSGGYVLDTLRAALWCLATTGSYADCVLEAVNLGADADTTAAVAGGLAGIRYGLDANPWRSRLRGLDMLDGIVDRAAAAFDAADAWIG